MKSTVNWSRQAKAVKYLPEEPGGVVKGKECCGRDADGREWIDMHAHSDPKTGVGCVPHIHEQCLKNGVKHVILSSLGTWDPYPSEAVVRDANDEAGSCAAASDGLIRWLAYLNPQNGNWRTELDRCLTEGAIGIKLWISLRDPAGSIANTTEVVRVAAAKGLPVLIHTLYRTDPPPSGQLALHEVSELARRFPNATLIAAHAGGFWRCSLGILRHLPSNALIDISGSFPEQGMLEALVKAVGADRILFGSDMLGRSLASQLAKVELATVSASDKEKILGENARRIFGPVKRAHGGKKPPKTRLRLPNTQTDHFCFCGKWPFFKTAGATPRALDRLLEEAGITRGFAADLGSVYRIDLANANAAFIRTCRNTTRISPLAVINPRAPDWKSTIEMLNKAFAGVILYPFLHNWRLDDDAYTDFFSALVKTSLPLWINFQLGDPRFRHSGLACRPVATDELTAFAQAYPNIRVIIQGATRDQVFAFLKHHPNHDNYRFELSRLTDTSGALATALTEFGTARFVMGSEFPLRDIREVRWAADRER